MCCLAFGFPVKKEIPAIAIPITESRGRITPVSLVLIPIKLVSSPACAKSGMRSPTAAKTATVSTICFLFINCSLMKFVWFEFSKGHASRNYLSGFLCPFGNWLTVRSSRFLWENAHVDFLLKKIEVKFNDSFRRVSLRVADDVPKVFILR